MTDTRQTMQQRQPSRPVQQPQKPGYMGAAMGTFLWLVAAAVLYAFGLREACWAVLAVAAVLFLVGCFVPYLRRGDSLPVVYLVPVWGLVARHQRVKTTHDLERVRLLRRERPTQTIPAHTARKRGGTTVLTFDGSGQPGMSPEHIGQIMEQEARFWGARSFTVDEDEQHPGRYTVMLYRSATPPSELDVDVVGVVV